MTQEEQAAENEPTTTAVTPESTPIESTTPEPGTPPQETPASPPVETQESRENAPPDEAPPAPPVSTPTDAPPPPGPQTTPGTRTDQPSFLAPRTEGGGRQEGASAYLPDGTPIDNVGIVRATVKNPQTGQDQEVTAAKTDPNAVVTGAAGQTMTAHEIGARGVTRTLAPQPQQVQQQPYTLIERYLQSAVHRTFGNVIGRSPTDLGLVGKGHVVVGHMILMDADSGELVRVLPGTRIEEDKILINTRCLPEFLVENPQLAKSAAGGGGA